MTSHMTAPVTQHLGLPPYNAVNVDIDHHQGLVATPNGVALLGLTEGTMSCWNIRTNQRRILTVIRAERATSNNGGAD